jgi:hypothetical protein
VKQSPTRRNLRVHPGDVIRLRPGGLGHDAGGQSFAALNLATPWFCDAFALSDRRESILR